MAKLTPFAITRARAQHARPYLSFALFAIHPVEVADIKNMSGDMHWRIYYDPVWLNELVQRNIGEAAWRLIHLVTHMLRKHGKRAQSNFILGEDGTQIWGMATDCEINDDILSVNDYLSDALKAPEQSFQPQHFGMEMGDLAEGYYKTLREMADESDGGGGDDGGGGGESYQSGVAQGPAPGDQGAADGSCATGQPQEYEQGDITEEHPGNSEARGDIVQMKVAHDIKNRSKTRGDVPAGWERWANGIIDPRVPWDKVLAARVRQALAYSSGLVDYSYSRPARRSVPNIIMPTLRRPKLRAGLIVDTSGSMSDNDLGLALGTIRGVLKSCGEDGVQVISADAAVHSVKQVFTEKQVRLYGDGGTDMRVPMEHFATMGKNQRPDVVVVITDGYTPWPEHEPKGIQWVTLLTSDGSEPGFGTVIHRHQHDSNERGW